MREAYLDNAATTRVDTLSAQAAMQAMRECYGNPSSLHTLGVCASRKLREARETVAALLGCESECVCFTSCGSEANNLAIFGAAEAKKRRGQHIVTTAAEHSSVAKPMQRLEELGWRVSYIRPDSSGCIRAEEIAQAITEDTVLLSMMLVNNETGALFPVEEAARLARRKKKELLIHCDGVQAFGKLPLRLRSSEIDLLSVSGHKICAPKGIGALYVRRGVRILPLIYGGGQERGLRSGTESLPLIAAFAAASGALIGKVEENARRTALLREAFLQKAEKIEGLCINSPQNSSPYIMNLSLPGYRSETMLHFLESRGIYVSSGSACSKGGKSPVLTAMGLTPEKLDSALRVSLIFDSQQEDLDALLQGLRDAQKELVRVGRSRME